MPKTNAMPNPWKRSREKGKWYRAFGDGFLIFTPSESQWHLEVHRGDDRGGCDRWGPWIGDLADEAKVLADVTEWVRLLDKCGWTSMHYHQGPDSQTAWAKNKASMVKALARLPRCGLIPFYLVEMLDTERAERGKAMAGGVIRVGGHDIHIEHPRDAWDARPTSSIYLTVQKPGATRRASGGMRLHLNGTSLDVFIENLLKARGHMVADDADVGIKVPQGLPMQERFAWLKEHGEGTAAILRQLIEMSPHQLETILMMTQMIKSGEMEVDFVYGEQAGQADVIH